MKNQVYYPKVSIVTITYNSEKTVEETIQSVVSQNYPNLEYLIIDGGSKDSTLDIVEKYRDKISFVLSEPDKGISDAFNKGVKYATGEIVGIINSDDLLMPGALKAIAESYDPEVGVYRGDLLVWNDETNETFLAQSSTEYSLRGFKKRHVCHPSTFITKAAYDKYGGYKVDFKYMMDEDILARLYMNGVLFKHVHFALAKFRLGGATSNSHKKKLKELERLYVENGCSKLYAKIRVVMFSLYYLVLNPVSRLIPMDTLRKLRYKRSE